MRRGELARSAGRGVAFASLLSVAACGSIQPQVAYPNVQPGAAATGAPAETPGAWSGTLEGLRTDDQRVANVAYRIVTANLQLCSDVKPQTGLVLQSALQYSPRLRPHAVREFHLDDRASIEAVAAGSPADLAGLRQDDVLLAVNGATLWTDPPPPPAPDERPATRAPVDAAEAALDAALAKGAARVRVQRGPDQLDAVLAQRLGCAYDAQVLPGSTMNDTADGRHVFVSAAMVDYARSDDMLAVLLGHEFAHDVMHHHQREDAKGFGRTVLGDFSSSPATHLIAEREADYVGLYLTARAGYDIANAPEFVGHIPEAIGDFGLTHPDNEARAAALAATRDEILAKRARGEPLVPNPAAPSR